MGLFETGGVETVAIIIFLIMLNVFIYNVVIHHDEPLCNCKAVENDCNWIKL